MKQGTLSFSVIRRVLDSPTFAYCTAFLVCGLFAGLFTGMHIPQQDDSYMNKLAELAAVDSGMLSVRQAVSCGAGVAVWYVIAVIVCSGRGRELWIALVLALRGFLMSFSIAAAIVGCGLKGCILSMLTTGISAVISVPALLIASAAALSAGRQKNYIQALRKYAGVFIITVLLTILAVLWRLTIPAVLNMLLNFI